MKTKTKKYLSVSQIAKMLGLSRTTIYTLRSKLEWYFIPAHVAKADGEPVTEADVSKLKEKS